MSGYGVKAYSKVSVESGVVSGDPHQLVLMLYDGAIAALREAFGHLKAGRVSDKGQAITKAIRIVDEGLRVSLDKSTGGPLAAQLSDLYEYMTLRLLQANLRNDASGLVEVAKLLDDLRSAWAQMRKTPTAEATAAISEPAGESALRGAIPSVDERAASFLTAPTSPGRQRMLDAFGATPARGFNASA